MPPRKKKKRNLLAPVLIVMVLFLLAGAGYIASLWYEASRTSMVRYPAFGIEMPAQYAIHGIDVSRYQDRISWKAVKEMEVGGIRLGFAFIKATEGADSKDPYFKRNWEKSKEAGIVRGAYHFFNPAKKGRPQALNFIRTVRLQPGDLPPVLDVETIGSTSGATLRKELRAWIETVQAHYGVRPLIYTNIYFYNRYLKGHFDDSPLWVAHYLQPDAPRIGRPWSFWQHSETGRVNGITARVDFNVFSGDSAAFRALLVP
jgi:lysozyme